MLHEKLILRVVGRGGAGVRADICTPPKFSAGASEDRTPKWGVRLIASWEYLVSVLYNVNELECNKQKLQ